MSHYEYTISEGVLCLARGTLSVLGCTANVISIRTFASMGLADGMNLSFLCLSVSDLMYLVTVLARAVSFLFMTLEEMPGQFFWFPVEPYGVYIFFGHAGRIPYILSNLTTTFLAVARCLCVARPLVFKNTFSSKIALTILSACAVFSVSSYVPILFYMGMIPLYDERTNATSRPSLWISPKREEVKDVVWGMRDAFVPFATQIVVIVCVITMSGSLRAASNFRHANSISHLVPRSHLSREACIKGNDPVEGRGVHGAKPNYVQSRLGGKELRVVQQVVLICVVYITCNTPTIFINFASVFESNFSIEKTYRNLYLTTTGAKHLFQTINASFNIFIYHNYNSKFKKRWAINRQ
ncbi:unnamed protein product [Lymnaea stagnalis]|uniref:G-protein coupled receptors family 1 profile domain-containing protein n=1 Tax=Lymnaea stagnalis TaxID=6523 RepID=A0AAV2HU07_LYMST